MSYFVIEKFFSFFNSPLILLLILLSDLNFISKEHIVLEFCSMVLDQKSEYQRDHSLRFDVGKLIK